MLRLKRAHAALILCLSLLNLPVLADDAYTHENSGLTFPKQVGRFVRDSASSNFLTGSFIVSYNGPAKNGENVAVTIYLTEGAGDPSVRFTALQKGIKLMHPEAVLLTEKKSTIGPHTGKICLYKLKILGSDQVSEGCLYRVGNHFFKLRMTGPFSEKRSLTSEVRTLLETVLAR